MRRQIGGVIPPTKEELLQITHLYHFDMED